MSDRVSPSDSVLRCEALGKTFQDGKLVVPVFDNINFTVSRGDRVAIVGTSGAGKTTLLQLLGGLDTPTSGRLWLGDAPLDTLSEREKCVLRNRHLGFVYQFHHLLPEFNVLENVAMPLLIRGERIADARDQAAAFLGRVGLSDRMTHRIGELSGGERQRVAIARALVGEPRCVLADEPTGNLDAMTSEGILELILELNEQSQTSFVVVTHNQGLAHRLGRVLSLEGGALVEQAC